MSLLQREKDESCSRLWLVASCGLGGGKVRRLGIKVPFRMSLFSIEIGR